MAEVIDSRIESRKVHPAYSVWLSLFVGLFVGLIYWLLSLAIERYTHSTVVSSGVAGILAATLGTLMMVGLRMSRPLIVTIAVALSTWNITTFVGGLNWIESVLWISSIYSLAYLVYSWIARYLRIIPVMVFTVTTIVLIRISLNL